MGFKVFLNGKFVEKDEAKISIFDHGVLYGDGVFEGIRSYGRKVFRLDEHLDRLYKGAEVIRLQVPVSKDGLKKNILKTLDINGLEDGYIRVVVTRGSGDLGLDPRKCAEATVFIIADKIVLYPEEFYKNGLPIVTSKIRRNHPLSISPEVKSLNYLNNIMGKIDAIDAGTNEALMLSVDGYVAECTGDNIFAVRGNIIKTPPFEVGALDGITKKAVMELSEKRGFEVVSAMMKPEELYSADECFLTGTAAEIIPVVKIDDKVIGDGVPGEKTKTLIRDFKELTKNEGVSY